MVIKIWCHKLVTTATLLCCPLATVAKYIYTNFVSWVLASGLSNEVAPLTNIYSIRLYGWDFPGVATIIRWLLSEVSLYLFVNYFFQIIMWLEPIHTGTVHPIYRLKTKVSVLLHFQLCSTCYTAVPINSCMKSSFVSNHYENADDLFVKGSHLMPPPNWHFELSTKCKGGHW